MKVKLIDLGHSKVNKEVVVKSTKELHREIQKHLFSKCWEMSQTDEDEDLYEVYAGFRTIGKVKIVEY